MFIQPWQLQSKLPFPCHFLERRSLPQLFRIWVTRFRNTNIRAAKNRLEKFVEYMKDPYFY